MTRRLTLLLSVLTMLGALLPAAGAAASTTSSYQGFGCFADPAGDVGDPRADLVELCVRYFPAEAAIVVSMEAATPFNPLGDPVWLNAETRVTVGFSIDGDDVVDRVLTIVRDDDALVARVTDADGGALDGCGALAEVAAGRFLRGQFNASCVDDADAVRATAELHIQPEAGGAVEVDRVPDAGMTVGIPRRDESPVCANAIVDPGELTVTRLACGGVITGTEPISQAVATSQYVFDNPNTDVIDPYRAQWVVLARDDDFADALAGSSLSFGQGPLLFTYSPASAAALGQDPNRLADITRAEILRSLPRGRTVYLLGGEAALAPGLDVQLTELGYEVVRLAGTGREQTARFIAQEVRRIVEKFATDTGFIDVNMVLVANRANWPDAVLAGSVGAFWGMPILLVDANLPIHPDTLAALDEIRPDYIHNIGGSAVISTDTAIAIREYANGQGYALGRPGEDVTSEGSKWRNFCAAGPEDPRYICRWGGDTRFGTAAAVTQLNRDMIGRFVGEPFIPDNPQQFAVGINLGGAVTSRNFAFVLAAATVSGRFGGAVFIPTDDNQDLQDITRNGLCATPGAERFVEQVEQFVLVGDTDLISNSFVQSVRDVARPGGC